MENLKELLSNGYQFTLEELHILHDKYGLSSIIECGKVIGFEIRGE